MTDYTDLIARLRYDCDEMFDPICGEAADALEAQARRIAELEVSLSETKLLLPQKIDEAPCRPPFISDWWSIAVLERRKRRKSEREYKARIAALEAALRPFADAADDLNEIDDAFLKSDVWRHPVAMNITINDLRAARAAMGENDE